MTWHGALWSAGAILLATLVWAYSPYVLDWVGLGDFDPLDRICLIFVLLSVGETLAARWRGH
jgi:hypothetical protein